MKAFILAAGNGTRLRPLTDDLPKCLLPIRGTPLLTIWLENCAAAGITEALVNVHAQREKMEEFVRQQASGVKVHIAEEAELLGSAGTLAANREFVEREKAFFVLYGDVLTNADLAELMMRHMEIGAAATLGIYQVPDPTQCGVVLVDGNSRVQSFVEKPAKAASNWVFSGVMVANPEVLKLIPEQRPADIGFHLLPKLVGQMAVCKLAGYVLDIGTINSYTAAQSAWPGLKQARALNNSESRT